MKKPFFLGALLLACAAQAETLVFENRDVQVRLNETPCLFKSVLDHLRTEYHARFKSADVTYQGQSYQACWVADQGSVFIIDETGENGAIDMHHFRKAAYL